MHNYEFVTTGKSLHADRTDHFVESNILLIKINKAMFPTACRSGSRFFNVRLTPCILRMVQTQSAGHAINHEGTNTSTIISLCNIHYHC